MEGLDEKLPNLGHGFKRAAAQGIGIHWHAAPSDDTQPLRVRRGFHGRARFLNHGSREKGKTDREHFRQLDSLLLSAGAEESLRERSEQTGAVAARSIRVDSSAVGEAL
jgi:ribose 1,5-bisphosphokinase PhnN